MIIVFKKGVGYIMYKIFLASKSPRRKELMEQIGLEFQVMVSEKEEIITSNVPKEVVKELSLQKAQEIERILSNDSGENLYNTYNKQGYEGVIIIGADTVVEKNGEIMGKPKDENEAFLMLKKLQGNKHTVSTGVAILVITEKEEKLYNFAESTDVYMYEASDEEIKKYIATKEPMDKAGSYGIQGIGAKFIKGIEGDYNNVVGLPIGRIYQTLKQTAQFE